ncbi:cyclophilin family peptidyl-prolyl cis-trans isomerase [Hamadaea flava]|uniref:Peptidylprolyl isomerase n=1 Tax=Hamadaea flava TaxID=1742688 RepID=A0ABV8LTX7_9ACTN|nr:peptidylprolyl isomerase [Hamadaea flava]MCP2328213.1 cyclophilin family peptidyl-prolyl cis-trans isomerase [Hamadaea flava]
MDSTAGESTAGDSTAGEPVKAGRGGGTAIVVAVVAAVLAAVAAYAWLGRDAQPAAVPSPTSGPQIGCEWTGQPTGATRTPAAPPPASAGAAGIATIRMTTNRGDIEIQADRSQAGCVIAGIAHLAGSGYYTEVACHRLLAEGFYFVQCGDPSGVGGGGPGYQYAVRTSPSPAASGCALPSGFPTALPTDIPTELLPSGVVPTRYGGIIIAPMPSGKLPPGLLPSGLIPPGELPSGLLPEFGDGRCVELRHFARGAVVAAVTPDNQWGGQFFLVYRDSDIVSDVPEFGRVTKGLEILDAVAAGGADAQDKPRTPLVIQAIAVT